MFRNFTPLLNKKIPKMRKSAFLLLFMICTIFMNAQTAELENIVKAERQSYAKKLKSHTSGILDNYDLKYHRFTWKVNPAYNAIYGAVTSYFTARINLSYIQFELNSGMSADSAYYHGVKKSVSHVGNILQVNIGSVISAGNLDSLTVYYHGIPDGSGFGSFGVGSHNEVPALWTLSEPYGASDWWPSKNDLIDKIDSIDVYVIAPNGNKVASNGIRISETVYDANNLITHWKHRYPVTSYLIAIAVTNYAEYSDWYIDGDDSLQIQNFVYPEYLAQRQASTPQTADFIGLYEDLFGEYPYDFEKYGHAEFGWGGGMEHQTMTFMGSGAFGFHIISHELGHQWFGDMVTCGSWHDIWLNEGFATYLTGLCYERIDPDPWWTNWKIQTISSVTSQPGGSVYCDDTTSVNRIFDGRLSYNKGAVVLHQLRWIVGDSAFFAGTYNYLHDPALQYGYAKTADYRQHIEASSGMDLTGYFNDWIYGQGYPSYTITCMPVSGEYEVTIQQTQSHVSVDFFALPVPILFQGDGKDTLIVFNNTSQGQSFTINPGFKVASMVFDPDTWLITKNNQLVLSIDIPLGRYLNLMPNPANDKVVIEQNIGKLKDVKIHTANGYQINCRTTVLTDNRTEISTADIPAGIYLLTAIIAGNTYSRKFTIVH